jgi:hypothetical protein
MNSEFTTLIRKMISEQGSAVLLNEARCKALLADYCRSDYKKERRLFQLALEAKIPDALVNAGSAADDIQEQAARRLEDDYMLAEDAASDVVAMLAGLLRKAGPAKSAPGKGKVKPATGKGTKPCPRCGKEIGLDWKACPWCGVSFLSTALVYPGGQAPAELVPKAGDLSNPDILAKFGILGSSAADISAALTDLHNYLSSKTPYELGEDDYIKPGDYIDLPSLTVPGSFVWLDSAGKYSSGVNTVQNSSFGDYAGPSLRLIVAGINTFARANKLPHVVFQFKNVPFGYSMNGTDSNQGGYKDSAIRKFLVSAFLPALEKAGIPEALLYAPDRTVGTDTISDKIWLPTEWEMFGKLHFSVQDEANKETLDYYESNWTRRKYCSPDKTCWYWEGSPDASQAAAFAMIDNHGNANSFKASALGGCAPAFCIQ